MERHVKLTAFSLLGHLRTTSLRYKDTLLTKPRVQRNLAIEGSTEISV